MCWCGYEVEYSNSNDLCGLNASRYRNEKCKRVVCELSLEPDGECPHWEHFSIDTDEQVFHALCCDESVGDICR